MEPLTYARTSPDRLPYRGDRLVWPVTAGRELRALRRTTALFGVGLQRVRATHFMDPLFQSSPGEQQHSLVAYPDPQLRVLAEIYARLTSRTARLIHVERIEEASPDIFVCLWKHLSLRVLENLHLSCKRNPMGILVAENPVELRVRVVRAAASAILQPMEDGKIKILSGRDTSFDQVRGRRAAVLLHIGHSDGLDLNFTRNEVLCGVSGDFHRESAWNPPCVRHHRCYRLGLPLELAIADKRLLRPSELRARAAIFFTCFGVPATDTLVPPRASLLEGLLRTDSLASVAIPFGIALPQRTDLEEVKFSLTHGAAIGDAIFRNPKLSDEFHRRVRILLFGDPRMRPMGAPRLPRPRTVMPSSRPPDVLIGDAPAGTWTSVARWRFIIGIMSRGYRSSPHLRDRWQQSLAGDESLNDGSLSRCLDGLAPFWDHWLPESAPLPRLDDDTTVCIGCGKPGRSHKFAQPLSRAIRLLKSCSRCGIFLDMEQGSRLVLFPPRVIDGNLEIPHTVAPVWVNVRLKDEMKVSRRWTIQPENVGNRRLTISHSASPGNGLATLHVTYIKDFEIASFQFALDG